MKMMAMVIDKKNYPVAVALLGEGFMDNEPKTTYGMVVVINELTSAGGSATYRPAGNAKRTVLANNLYDMEDFFKKYEFVFPKHWRADKRINIKRLQEITPR